MSLLLSQPRLQTLPHWCCCDCQRPPTERPHSRRAILAVAASRPTVVAGKDGSIAVKRQMQVNLTADHRVIYGADAAAFLKDLAELIETRPESLAL